MDFEKAKQHFLTGLDLFEKGQFQDAEQQFLASLQIIPDRVSTLTNLSGTYIKLRKFLEARNYSQKAIAYEENNSEAYLNIGVIEKEQGNFNEAVEYFEKAIKITPNYPQALLGLASSLVALGRYEEALRACNKVISIDETLHEAWLTKGVCLTEINKPEEALETYNKKLKIQPGNLEALFRKANLLHKMKCYEEALLAFNEAINLDVNLPSIWSNRGVTLSKLRRYEEALISFNRALKLAPDDISTWFNKGVALNQTDSFVEALECFDQVISIETNNAEAWFNRGITLEALNRLTDAQECYNKAIDLKPEFPEAYNNLGNVLKNLHKLNESLTAFSRAIDLKKNFAEALSNKGVVLFELSKYDLSLKYFDHAIAINNKIPGFYANQSEVLKEVGRPNDAVDSLSTAYEIDSNYQYVLGNLGQAKMQVSEWSNYDQDMEALKAGIFGDKKVSTCFPVVTLIDSLILQRKVAEKYIHEKHQFNKILGPMSKSQVKNKICVGYYSADFHQHATTHLIAELFEKHDKSRFEIIAFSFGPDQNDNSRQRLLSSFDQFIDVRFESDEEVARLSRKIGIDIAVDLKGFTRDSRPGIFSFRAAPIQINYLGYPGTMGADYIDYIVADETLIPEESQAWYSEKIIYLPGSYQVNDRKRVISNREFSRFELGLPERGFVFCCFNNNYKITPHIFDIWMRILDKVDECNVASCG